MPQLLANNSELKNKGVLKLKHLYFMIPISLLAFLGTQTVAHADCRLCGHHFEKLPADKCTMELMDEVDDSVCIMPEHAPSQNGKMVTYKIRNIIITIPASASKDIRWAKVPPVKSHIQPVPQRTRAHRTGRNPQTGATIPPR